MRILSSKIPCLIILVFLIPGCKFSPFANIESAGLMEMRTQIEAVNCDNAYRYNAVKKLFRESGADDDDIKTEVFGAVENITMTLKGKSDEIVVVGAHYDKTSLGCGAIDNWTGIVIVANLYRTLKSQRNEKTYKFVAFGKEERGLLGSKGMVAAISDQAKANYCAMINLDSFGFTQTWVLEDISDKKLVHLAREIAKARNASFKLKRFKGASSDSKPFLEQGIPAITFSGLSDNWKDYLHKKGDQVDKIDFSKVYENYLFTRDFLELLDAKNCGIFR